MKRKPIIGILAAILIVLIAAIAALCFIRGGTSQNGTQPDIKDNEKQETVVETEESVPEDSSENDVDVHLTANIAVAGDIVAHTPINNNAYDGATGEYNYDHLFTEAAHIFRRADFSIVDFESTFSGDGSYSGFPLFDSPDSWATALKNSGIDMVALANNHSLDTWFDGLCRTIDVMEANGLEHIGTYRTQEERDKNHGVVVQDINGITIAFLDYTYGTNGLPRPEGKEFAVNIFNKDYMTTLSQFDYEKVGSDLEYARSLDTDLIAFIIHWGVEYQTSANEYQKQIADYLLSEGVDMILGGHAHVPQQMEMRQVEQADGSVKNCLVAYCLGNFISNQYDPYTDLTAVLEIEVDKDVLTGETVIKDAGYTPMIMVRAGNYGFDKYALLDIHKEMAKYEAGEPGAVSRDLYERMVKGLSDIRNIVGEEFDKAD